MTRINAVHHSVSVPLTAERCGQALSAPIRRIENSGDGRAAAIPETVIIGDRGHHLLAGHSAPKSASLLHTLFNLIKQPLRHDDHQHPLQEAPSLQAEDHA